jgi:hypothetical protein
MMQVVGGAERSANLGKLKNKQGYTAFESSFKNSLRINIEAIYSNVILKLTGSPMKMQA